MLEISGLTKFFKFIWLWFISCFALCAHHLKMKIQNILYRGKIFQYGIFNWFIFICFWLNYSFFYTTHLLSDTNFKFDQVVNSTVTVFQNCWHGVTQIDRVQKIMEEHMRNGFCRNFSLGKSLKIYKTFPFQQILTG